MRVKAAMSQDYVHQNWRCGVLETIYLFWSSLIGEADDAAANSPSIIVAEDETETAAVQSIQTFKTHNAEYSNITTGIDKLGRGSTNDEDN